MYNFIFELDLQSIIVMIYYLNCIIWIQKEYILEENENIVINI